jgi:hypothetical protein
MLYTAPRRQDGAIAPLSAEVQQARVALLEGVGALVLPVQQRVCIVELLYHLEGFVRLRVYEREREGMSVREREGMSV